MIMGMIRIAILLAALCAAWQPSSALAADEDVQFWLYGVVTGDLDDNTRLTLDASARWREQRRGDEQQTLRINVEQEIADFAQIGGGVGVFEAGGVTEIRPHQEMTLTAGRLSARTRIEQRFFDNADRVEVRLRQRLRYSMPVSSKIDARLDGEFFHLAQTQLRNSDAARDQWRGRAEIGWRTAPRLRVAIAYLVIYTPTPFAPDPVNHVPQVWIEHRF